MLRQIFINSLMVRLGVIGVDLAMANPSGTNNYVLALPDSSLILAKQPSESQKYGLKQQEQTPKDDQSIPKQEQNQDSLPELNPNPNPLSLPTEQELKKSQENLLPLSLERAIELAKKNSQQLKIARLQLEASLASLAEAEAALYPSIGLEARAARSQAPTGELAIQAQRRREQATLRGFETQLQNSQAAVNFLQRQIDFQQAQLASSGQNQTVMTPLLIDESTIEELSQVFVTRQEATAFITQQQTAESIRLEFLQRDLQQAQGQLEQQQQQINSTRRSIDELTNFATTTINGTARLTYNIYDSRRQPSISRAKEDVLINELEVQRVEAQLRLDVALAYYDLQQADAQVIIFESDVEDRTKRLEGIRMMLDAAVATKLDLLNAEVDLDNAIQELRNVKVNQETARRNLARLLNLSPSFTPTASDLVQQKGEWDLALDQTILLALNNRVELEQQLAQRRRAQKEKQLALAAVRPNLALFAEYSVVNLNTDDPSPFVARGTEDGYSFGLNFNWTFFDGGAATAGARRADATAAIAEQQYSETANTIRLEVERAYYQLKPQLENIKTATESVRRAQEAVRAAQIRFQAGVNTQTEVLDAQNRLVRAKNNLVNAIITYNRSLAQLERAVSLSSQELNNRVP